MAASAAAAVCSENYRLATAEYVQLHGGIGFTLGALGLHLYVRRARSSEVLFGTADQHRTTGSPNSSASARGPQPERAENPMTPSTDLASPPLRSPSVI
ncbi:hypothetical protein SALBM311S_03054 [Streptomyces alboniger]